LAIAQGALKAYFNVGIPKGNSIVQSALTLTPKLVSLSVQIGSAGGTLILANIHGIGLGTTGLELVDSTGTSICQRTMILGYGYMMCQTNIQDIAAASAISVKHGTTVHACANADPTKCQFE
jgi:hypothetical protein